MGTPPLRETEQVRASGIRAKVPLAHLEFMDKLHPGPPFIGPASGSFSWRAWLRPSNSFT